MKKSIIAIGVGAFILVTVLLCMNTEVKMYQKQKHFDNVNDVLTQLENNEIRKSDRNSERDETDEFQECLSKRKRLTYSEIDYKNIKINKVEELDNEKKKSLIEDYNKIQKELAMPYKPTKIEPVRLDIQGTYPHKDQNGNVVTVNSIIDLIMVDEGEGMVIDYYVEGQVKSSNGEEGHTHAKG